MRGAKLAWLFAVLLLAGCQSAPAPQPVVQAPRTGLARGIDLPTDSSDVLGELRGFPIEFVARYYRDPTSRWPALTAAEAQRLSAQGYKIVTVWEWHSHDPAYFSYASGYNDALNAYRQAKSVGQPAGSAIYFAVDFNAHGSDLYNIDQYFRGIANGFTAAGAGRPDYKVGVYGSGSVCAAVKGARLAQYAWLSGSTAWEGSAGYSAWNIKQAAQGARFGQLSFNHDANEARDDYGGFQLGSYANTTNPAVAVMTAAAAVPVAVGTAVNGAVSAVVSPMAAATAQPAPPAPPAPPAISAAPARTAAAPPVASAQAVAVEPVPTVAAVAAPAPAIAAAPPQKIAPVASIAPATPRAPPPGSAAAEVAAAAAAEPLAGQPPSARTRPHAAERRVVAKRKPEIIAASHRVGAAPSRHANNSASTEAHRSDHRASPARRAENRGVSAHPGKPEPAHAAERHGAERQHRARSTPASDG